MAVGSVRAIRAATPEEIAALQQSLRGEFNIGLHLFIPLLLMLFMVYRRFPAFPAIVISALSSI